MFIDETRLMGQPREAAKNNCGFLHFLHSDLLEVELKRKLKRNL